ncbi:DNA helicase, partial [Tanacetum coccineum]
RIDFIHEHQNDIRNEYLSRIYDAINRGDTDGSDCEGQLILPQSFTGATTDCADIVDRVFEMKVQQFVKYLCDAQPFGKTVAVLYTIEFQKRGLPHCHTLLWIHDAARVHRDEDIDLYVSAELPSKHTDPECYRIVSELMIHGPCGLAYPSAPCTQNHVDCKKHSPKEYCSRTYTDKYGFAHYQERDTADTVLKQHVELDNRYVVPYNRELLTTFYAHINVEYCGWTMLIKYLFKYISKGTNRIVARISKTKTTAQYWTDSPQRHKSSIGRLIYVHPAGDLFYQRMLLCHQKGCRSFPEIRKVNDIVYPTCRAACQALGLL